MPWVGPSGNNNRLVSLTCVWVRVSVCLAQCEKVCQWISDEQLDRFEWKFRCMLQLASNRETPLASTIGPIFPHSLGRVSIFVILWTLISRKPLKTSRNRKKTLVDEKIQDLQYKFQFIHFFDIYNGFWDISKKKLFLKNVPQGLGVSKTSWWGSKYVKNVRFN